MSIVAIGDEQTILGMNLVGVAGEVVANCEQAQAVLNEVLGQSDVHMVLITEYWSNQIRDTVDQLRLTRLHPLVVEIPGSAMEPAPSSLREVIQAVAGVHLGGGL